MNLATYLRSSWPAVALAAFSIAMCGFVLAVSASGAAVSLLACGIVTAGFVLSFAVEYLRRRSFYRTLDRYASTVEHPLWITEAVDRPDFVEGEIVYDALAAVAKAANDDVASYRRQAVDYREYIETWVHETKSPLAAAHLMLDNLQADPSLDGAYPKLDALDEELRRVEGYVEQALFYARSEAVERDYLIRSYSLDSLVADAIKANAPSLIAAHIAPVRRGLDYSVFTDQKWIEFILGQVIQNSVKYAGDDHPFIEFSARLLNEGGASECVELTVRDNGCGVGAADLPRVFEKGFTGENGRVGKRSTGIGLYLVKRLCDKMGVGVEAASCEGEGFAVMFRFSTNRFHYIDGGSSRIRPLHWKASGPSDGSA